MVETVPVTSASLGHVLLMITLRLRGSTRMLAWLRSAHLGRPSRRRAAGAPLRSESDGVGACHVTGSDVVP